MNSYSKNWMDKMKRKLTKVELSSSKKVKITLKGYPKMLKFLKM
jgi:hypothetical protein